MTNLTKEERKEFADSVLFDNLTTILVDYYGKLGAPDEDTLDGIYKLSEELHDIILAK